MLIDLRTGLVDTLLGWTRNAWMALARTGDSSSVPATVGVPAEQVDDLVRQLYTDGPGDRHGERQVELAACPPHQSLPSPSGQPNGCPT